MFCVPCFLWCASVFFSVVVLLCVCLFFVCDVCVCVLGASYDHIVLLVCVSAFMCDLFLLVVVFCFRS